MNKDNKEYDEQLKQIENIEARVKEINDALFEIDELGKSTQVYSLKPRIEMPGTTNYTKKNGQLYEKKNDGETYYEKGVVVMEYNLGDLSMQGHELKHGYQFEKRLVSFNRATGTGGLLYDLGDEVDAYRRGSAFDGNRSQPLLIYSHDELIKMGYNLPTINISGNTLIEDYFRFLNYPSPIFEMDEKYFGKNLLEYDKIDIVR